MIMRVGWEWLKKIESQKVEKDAIIPVGISLRVWELARMKTFYWLF